MDDIWKDPKYREYIVRSEIKKMGAISRKPIFVKVHKHRREITIIRAEDSLSFPGVTISLEGMRPGDVFLWTRMSPLADQIARVEVR